MNAPTPALLPLLKRKRAILRARDDLIDFIRYMRPTPDAPDDVDQSLYEPVRHHRAVAAALEKVASGELKRLIITLPPRHGKTTLASHAFPPWFIGRHPQKSMILATYNEKFSWDFGRAVREIMQQPQYNQVFPHVRLQSGAASVDRLEVEGGGVLFFAGVGSSITGRGGDVILVDDPVKNRKDADSPTFRDHTWLWFRQVLTTRLMTEHGAIVIIMTRWHEDDIIGRLTDRHNPYYVADEAAAWRIISLPAIAGLNDLLGRKEGEALWPERFGVDYLDVQRRSDPRGFQSLYQGNPTPIDGSFFKSNHFRTYTHMREVPPFDSLRFYIASDHAVATEQHNDKTCMLPVGIDGHNHIWVLPEIFWQRAPTDTAVETMLVMMEKYKPQYWWAEKGHITKSIGPFLRKRMLEKHIYCAIDEIQPAVDKTQRAQAIQARMAMGMVHFPAFARWWADAQDQMLKFPNGTFDDFVDALSMIGLGLAKQTPRGNNRKTDAGPKPFTLGWIKAQSKAQQREDWIKADLKGW